MYINNDISLIIFSKHFEQSLLVLSNIILKIFCFTKKCVPGCSCL